MVKTLDQCESKMALYEDSHNCNYEIGINPDQATVHTYEEKVVPLEGRKYDQDKVRMELIPPELLEATAAILTFGAKKYEDRNWEKGMKWSRVFGALMRHLWAWWGGEVEDPETGKSHLWHSACCIAFLIAYEEREVGEDDRPNV